MMNKRIIYIGSPSKLSIKDSQLVITNRASGETNSIPIEDISVIELDNPQILLNAYLLQYLAENKAALICCASNHLPNGIFTPLAGHHAQSLHIRNQVNVKKPLLNRLWKSIIYRKVNNQKAVLQYYGLDFKRLESLLSIIKSGDKTNIEAQASRYYWKALFSKDFKRDPDGDFPNQYLNYGYSLVRTLAARELVSTGLHPTIGIHHKSQYNSYCLADDVMEAYRPYVDLKVKEIADRGDMNLILSKESKIELLEIMISIIKIGGENKTMVNAMQDTCDSLMKSYKDAENKLRLPEIDGTQPV